jgi:hypothetical protein
VLLGVALAALAMAGTVSSASAVSVRPAAEAQSAAATPPPVLYSTPTSTIACPDVMVIGARGAGEAPSGILSTSAYTSDQYHGAGKTVFSLYQDLSSNNTDLSFSLYPVVYPADPIFEPPPLSIVPNPDLPNDAKFGAKTIATDIMTTDIACGAGKVHYILAGYSLGAWAVQDALNQLTSTQLQEITGVALFGNPLFVPFAPVVRDNQSADKYLGLGVLLDLSDLSIPKAVVSRTGSWCFSNDPVCQAVLNPQWPQEALLCSLNPSNPSLCAHVNYPGAETDKAAAFLQPFLPAPTSPGTFQWTTSILGATSSSPPLPANAGSGGYAYLFSVACPSTGSCVAVGNYMNSSGNWQGLIETLSGGSWEATEVTLPGNAEGDTGSSLDSVACPSTTSCVAVGDYNNGASALVVTGSGTTWKATEAPLPANASGGFAVLNSVACPSATSCVAAGDYYGTPAGTPFGLIVTGPAGSGTTWTPTEAPLPANGISSYLGEWPAVACMSATSCVAIWTYDNSSGTQQGVLDSGSGNNWTPSEVPLPGDASTSTPEFILGSATNGAEQPVACSTATCVAIGHYVDSSGIIQSLLVTGSGTNWTQTQAPKPANASGPFTVLNSVACQSATTCVAAGEYSTSSGTQGLMLTGSGTSWTPAAAPVPADALTPLQTGLYSVTCPSTSWCVIAGSYATAAPGGGQTAAGLAVIGSGTSWTTTLAPLPGNANSVSIPLMNSVACPSATSCVIAGQYSDGTNWHGLLATGAP